MKCLLASTTAILLWGCATSRTETKPSSYPEVKHVQADPQPFFSQVPEMVAATAAPVVVEADPKVATMAIHAPTGPASILAANAVRRVYLVVENVTAEIVAPSCDVYVNVPAGEQPKAHPELRAGKIGLFGVVEASEVRRGHPDNGLSFSFDVTDMHRRLSASPTWDAKNLQLTFVADPWDGPVKFQVGRASLYYKLTPKP